MNAFVHEKRKRFSERDYAEAFAAANGHCQKCTRKIMAGEDWDLDHRIALENGGSNDMSNMQVLCSFCHDGKTADDHGKAAKSKRIATKHTVPSRLRKKRGWR